jgi:hypothetical protein
MSKSNPNTGAAVSAEYTKQELNEYQNNPLIEALPPIWSFEQVEELLHAYPECEEYERKLDPHYRYHCVQRVYSYFQPWSTHFDIEQRISRAIRQGYLSRNPLAPNYAADLQMIYKMIKQGDYSFKNQELSSPTASGFSIIGFSGMGKTTAVESILNRYPQIILHSKYRQSNFDHKQLVWLKLDCPFDGSVKGLCTNFFTEFDRLMADNTYNKFAAGRNTTTATMIPQMAQIARRHSLGVLVIDEIQHLSVAKSGGQEKMLNFFVNLVNTIGIPVILIGTTKALSILQGEFRQARRGSGQQGDLVWENMENDENWELLIDGMWRYQWIRKPVPLTKEFQDALYNQSQGIVDIVMKLFIMAQIRAIATGEETITVKLIETVANENLRLVKPMLDALKSGKRETIIQFADITPININGFCEKQLKAINVNEMIRIKSEENLKKQNDKDQIFDDVILRLVAFEIKPDRAKRAAVEIMKTLQGAQNVDSIFKEAYKLLMKEELKKEETPKIINIVNKNNKCKESDDLRTLVENGRKEKKSAYEALKDTGVIKNPIEEFNLLG